MTTDTMIVSTFDDKTIAGKAMKALRDEGFREGDIKILQGGTDTLVSELVKRGFDEDEARGLADAAEQGKTLLAALVSEDKADQAASIMDRFEAAQDDGQDKAKRLRRERADRRGGARRRQGQVRHRRGPRDLQRRGAADRGNRDAAR